ncbi:hypothetical protein H4R21_004492, partial [Coemansia helicoidea]
MSEPLQPAPAEKVEAPPSASRMSMSNASDTPAPTTAKAAAFRRNIAQMFVDRKQLKHLYTFIGLCVISFLPLIFAGIALSLSSPSNAAKIAVYLTTLAIAFVSIGFSGWLAYGRLCRAIAADEGLPTRRGSEVDIVGAPVEAFSPSQQHYNRGDDGNGAQPPPHSVAMRIPEFVIPPVPPLPPIGQMPHPLPYQGGSEPQQPLPMTRIDMPLPPQPAVRMEMPLPPRPAAAPPPAPPLPFAAPPAPPLPPSGLPVPPPVHRNDSKGRGYDGRLSASDSKAQGLAWGADTDSIYNDDEIKLYSFEKVKVHPDRAQGYARNPRMSRSVPDLNYGESEYGDDDFGTPRAMLVGSELPARPEAAGRGSSIYEQARSPQARKVPAASSIDDLVETMLETYTDASRPNTTYTTDSSRPNTTVGNMPPPVPLPLPRPQATMNPPLPTSAQRKDDDRDFLDSDSDGASSRGVTPSPGPRPDAAGSDANSRWKPASVNFDNIAAHIAQALNGPGGPQSSIGELYVANVPPTRDSVSIEVRTPDFSPR